MSFFLRGLLVIAAGVVLVSLAGAGSVAALLGLAGFLVLVIGLALKSSRPKEDGGKPARSLLDLSRYRPGDGNESLPAVVLASFAMWSVFELGDVAASALLPVSAVLVVAYVVVPRVTPQIIGVFGSIATTLALVVGRGCGSPTSAQGLIMWVVVLAVSVLAFVLVRRGSFSFLPSFSGTYSRATWALILFGLLDFAAFAVRPTGVEIWRDAPAGARLVLLVLVLVLAALAAYSPQVVLWLTALGVAVGQVFLLSVQQQDAMDAAHQCSSPGMGLAFAVMFSLLVVLGLSFRPGRRIR